MISEPVLVAVIFHYEQHGREGRGKEIIKSVCPLVIEGIGFRVTWIKRGGEGFLGVNRISVCRLMG